MLVSLVAQVTGAEKCVCARCSAYRNISTVREKISSKYRRN